MDFIPNWCSIIFIPIYSQTCFSDNLFWAITFYYVTLILIPFTVHFILIKPVFSDHLSYVTLFQYSCGGSQKTGYLKSQYGETCLNRTLNKPKSCINWTLNKSPNAGNIYIYFFFYKHFYWWIKYYIFFSQYIC